MSNLKIDGLINKYGNLYFHAYLGRVTEQLRIKVIIITI